MHTKNKPHTKLTVSGQCREFHEDIQEWYLDKKWSVLKSLGNLPVGSLFYNAAILGKELSELTFLVTIVIHKELRWFIFEYIACRVTVAKIRVAGTKEGSSS